MCYDLYVFDEWFWDKSTFKLFKVFKIITHTVNAVVKKKIRLKIDFIL